GYNKGIEYGIIIWG
ncbi:unnamed protein product, partial [Rotaria sp. Silwood1]